MPSNWIPSSPPRELGGCRFLKCAKPYRSSRYTLWSIKMQRTNVNNSEWGHWIFCEELKPESAIRGLWAKSSPSFDLVNKVLLRHSQAHYSYTVIVCFHETVEQTNACNDDFLGCKSKIIYYLSRQKQVADPRPRTSPVLRRPASSQVTCRPPTAPQR